jgi:hypothetical protein
MYVVGYKVYHHSPLLVLHNIVCKRKLVNFNEYNLRIYNRIRIFVTTYFYHFL